MDEDCYEITDGAAALLSDDDALALLTTHQRATGGDASKVCVQKYSGEQFVTWNRGCRLGIALLSEMNIRIYPKANDFVQ